MENLASNSCNFATVMARDLYSEPDVFVRELIQNAHDSIELLRVRDPSHLGCIQFAIEPENGRLLVADNGIGMDRQVIEAFLLPIGHSGTRAISHALRAEGRFDPATIGEFGIGLMSAFAVADRVDIITQHRDSAKVWHWSKSGAEDHRLELLTGNARPGTRVILTMRSEFAEFLDDARLVAVIRRYADFIPYPIFLDERGPINAIRTPWETSHGLMAHEREQLWRSYLTKRYGDQPLLIIPIDIPALRTRGLLYVADQDVSGIHTMGFVDVYQNRMCVRHRDPELLPAWAKPVRGLIDSRNLQPTTTRGDIRHDEAYYSLRGALRAEVLTALEKSNASAPSFLQCSLMCKRDDFVLRGK